MRFQNNSFFFLIICRRAWAYFLSLHFYFLVIDRICFVCVCVCLFVFLFFFFFWVGLINKFCVSIMAVLKFLLCLCFFFFF